MDRYMGIDPGIKGGICIMTPDYKVCELYPMPSIANEYDIKKLKEIVKSPYIRRIYIEQVHAIFKVSAKATFKLGYGAGIVEAVVSCSERPYTMVRPKAWQKHAHIGLDKNLKIKAKEKSLLAVSKRYPEVSFLKTLRSKIPHDGLVDATLIAEYGVSRHVR